MPIRSAKSQFSIGIDIAKTSRFKRLIDNALQEDQKLLRFIDRVFTGPEQQLLWHRYQSPTHLRDNPLARDNAIQYIASRWAAKEAIIKAYKPRGLFMLDIEIHARHRAAPFAVVLDGRRPRFGDPSKPQAPQVLRALEEMVRSSGVAVASGADGHGWRAVSEGDFGGVLPVPESTDGEEVEVSLSHDEEFVVAMALVTTKHGER